jgi:hypothetical protein
MSTDLMHCPNCNDFYGVMGGKPAPWQCRSCKKWFRVAPVGYGLAETEPEVQDTERPEGGV